MDTRERQDSARIPTRGDGTKSGRVERNGISLTYFPLCALWCVILYFCTALLTTLKMEAEVSSETLNFFQNPRDCSKIILCQRNGLCNFGRQAGRHLNIHVFILPKVG
jgi:hypothetical protein